MLLRKIQLRVKADSPPYPAGMTDVKTKENLKHLGRKMEWFLKIDHFVALSLLLCCFAVEF